jgi:hypothetical protein
VSANACPALAAVIRSCWDKDPTMRMTTAQIVETLSNVNWILVRGVEAADALLASVPTCPTMTAELDATAPKAPTDVSGAAAPISRTGIGRHGASAKTPLEVPHVAARPKAKTVPRDAVLPKATKKVPQAPMSPAELQERVPNERAEPLSTVGSMKPQTGAHLATNASDVCSQRTVSSTEEVPLAVYPAPGTLLGQNESSLKGFGIPLLNARLLTAPGWSSMCWDFERKIVERGLAPTLVLVEWKAGFVVGGFAAVAWPKLETQKGATTIHWAADPDRASFIFSLKPNARRFALVDADTALVRRAADFPSWHQCDPWRAFWFGDLDLRVFDDGTFRSFSGGSYEAFPHDGSFPEDNTDAYYKRVEVWAL